MRREVLAAMGVASAATAAIAYANAGGGSTETGIFGRAVAGGPCPVSLEVQRGCAEHPVRATIIVKRGRSRVATLRAGRAGRFRKELAPGRYRLEPQPVGSAYAPVVSVQVPADHYVRVNVRYRASNR